MDNMEIFKLSISDAVSYLEKVSVNFDDLQEELKAIKIELESSDWQGDSNEKCIEIQAAIADYYEKLRPCFDQLEKTSCALQFSVEGFSIGSINIEQMGRW